MNPAAANAKPPPITVAPNSAIGGCEQRTRREGEGPGQRQGEMRSCIQAVAARVQHVVNIN